MECTFLDFELNIVCRKEIDSPPPLFQELAIPQSIRKFLKEADDTLPVVSFKKALYKYQGFGLYRRIE